jgi:hypothetical protein
MFLIQFLTFSGCIRMGRPPIKTLARTKKTVVVWFQSKPDSPLAGPACLTSSSP